MKATWPLCLGIVFVSLSLTSITRVCSDEPVASNSEGNTPKSPGAESDAEAPTLEVARDRAKVMHDVHAATLEVLHDRYFHGPRAMVPARAMQDVFSAIKQESKVEARWISVSMKPMSIDHAPESDFEKKAAKENAAGKSHFEVVEDGYYRRAGAIPLSSGCVGCHGGFFKEPSKKPKFAGLVISVPICKSHRVESK